MPDALCCAQARRAADKERRKQRRPGPSSEATPEDSPGLPPLPDPRATPASSSGSSSEAPASTNSAASGPQSEEPAEPDSSSAAESVQAQPEAPMPNPPGLVVTELGDDANDDSPSVLHAGMNFLMSMGFGPDGPTMPPLAVCSRQVAQNGRPPAHSEPHAAPSPKNVGRAAGQHSTAGICQQSPLQSTQSAATQFGAGQPAAAGPQSSAASREQDSAVAAAPAAEEAGEETMAGLGDLFDDSTAYSEARPSSREGDLTAWIESEEEPDQVRSRKLEPTACDSSLQPMVRSSFTCFDLLPRCLQTP